MDLVHAEGARMATRVHLADDHTMFREGLQAILAARGLSNRLIAQELHISEATVKRHLANIYEKVGVHSRNDAVRTALVEQWIGIHEITSPDGDGSRDGRGG